jgi:hypothetical protein
VDFDCSNIEHYFGEKGSFDSSKCEEGEQGTPLRRRHSLEITSPHDGNLSYKRLKHSLSLPHESGHDYAQLTAPSTSFGSNTSDLTPIGIGLTPRIHNQILPHKPNSSPVSIVLPPKLGVTNIFQSPPTSSANNFLQPRANNSNFLSRDTNSRDIQHVTGTPSNDNAKRQKIILPPRLVPEDNDGRRLLTIFGSSKQCTDTRYANLDTASQNLTKQRNLVILTNPNLIKDRALTGYEQFYFLVAIYPALQGFTFLLPGLKKQMSGKNPCSIPGLKIQVSSLGSFKLGRDKLEDEVCKSWFVCTRFGMAKSRLTNQSLSIEMMFDFQARAHCFGTSHCKATDRQCNMRFWWIREEKERDHQFRKFVYFPGVQCSEISTKDETQGKFRQRFVS